MAGTSATQGTDTSPGGATNTGPESPVMVYVYVQSKLAPPQSVYVHTKVFVPEHAGSALMTGPVAEIGSPHAFVTTGGVGTVCASLLQGTVDPSSAGRLNMDGMTVYVYVQSADAPEQSVYVQVYVFVPEQSGSAPTTGPVTVSGSPHELLTIGLTGTT